MKICRICNKEKSFDEFHTRKLKNNIGYRNECKECRCLIEKKRRNSNLDEYKKKDKEYYQKNKEKHNNKSKEYRIKNREQIIIQKKNYYEKNKNKIKLYHQQNKNNRNLRIRLLRKTSRVFAIKESIRSRIHELFKNKKTSTSLLIGTNNNNLKKWIEIQFDEKMNWNNYNDYWVIDHVIPLSFFNIINENEKLMCTNWINLRPYEKKENMKKSNKIIISEILNHIKLLKQISLLNEGYQTYYENSMWQRLELWYGKNSTDEENFKDFLKWAIRSKVPNLLL